MRAYTVFLLISLFVFKPASAQDAQHPYLGNTFVVNAGAFFPDDSFKIRVDGTVSGENDFVDFDSELGIGRADETASFEILWRFGEKWSLRAQHYSVSESDQVTLGQDIEWGDLVFGSGTGVAVGSELSITRLFFGRRFVADERQEFGIGLGLHRLQIDAFIEGDVVINGVGDPFRSEFVDVDGPLPNFGAWYMFSPAPNWVLQARLDWLSAEVDKYDGVIANASVGVNYRLGEHVGIGLNYNYFRLDVVVDDSGWRGEVDVTQHGPFAYLSLYW